MVEKKKPTRAPARKGAPVKPKAKALARGPAKTAPSGAAASKKVAKAEPARQANVPSAKAASPGRPTGFGIHSLAPSFGATHSHKRVGRGPGSGHGKTAGRGNKGQKSRSGYHHLRGFEGGQMPLHRRVPKRGFTNIFRVEYDIVNLSALDRFDAGEKVTPELLIENRLARKSRPVKILGDGQIAKPLLVAAHKFSASAQAKIEAAGGRCEVIPR
jgi:large subunit ribosomal protein L15